MSDLVERLKVGASIARDRNLYLDYAEVADRAAAEIESLRTKVVELEAPLEDFEDELEKAFWIFDAKHKGYGKWKPYPMSERDAFKTTVRGILNRWRTIRIEEIDEAMMQNDERINQRVQQSEAAYLRAKVAELTEELEHREKNGSDGYHTFTELYEHRHALYIKLLRCNPSISWRANNHHDGTMYPNWFIAGMQLPAGQVSYHLPVELWEKLNGCGIATSNTAPIYDGHSPADVVTRLNEWTPETEKLRAMLREIVETIEGHCDEFSELMERARELIK